MPVFPTEKPLSVSALKKGTVIDHIPAGSALRIIDLLMFPGSQRQMVIGLHLSSASMILKDMIKIEDELLSDDEVNQVCILAPLATISFIQDYEVMRKFKVTIPDSFQHAHLLCPNHTCITNFEHIPPIFSIIKQINHVMLNCKYCEKTFSQREIKTISPMR
jgi:aspartate carbamoyltransferase regulatory subunit